MKKKTCIIKDRSGFTIIELLVGMVILAIVAGFAIPVFAKWLPNYHLKSAARDMFSSMQLAKLEAVKRNSTCAVTVGSNSYEIALLDRTVSLEDYGSGVKFGGPNSGDVTDSPFTFNARGMTDETSAQYVYLTNEKNTAYYQIVVTSMGNIAIKKRNGSTWE